MKKEISFIHYSFEQKEGVENSEYSFIIKKINEYTDLFKENLKEATNLDKKNNATPFFEQIDNDIGKLQLKINAVLCLGKMHDYKYLIKECVQFLENDYFISKEEEVYKLGEIFDSVEIDRYYLEASSLNHRYLEMSNLNDTLNYYLKKEKERRELEEKKIRSTNIEHLNQDMGLILNKGYSGIIKYKNKADLKQLLHILWRKTNYFLKKPNAYGVDIEQLIAIKNYGKMPKVQMKQNNNIKHRYGSLGSNNRVSNRELITKYIDEFAEFCHFDLCINRGGKRKNNEDISFSAEETHLYLNS